MRTMARAVVLLLVVAFVAGVWDARYGADDQPRGRSGPPFRTAPAERSRAARLAPELVSVATSERDGYDRVLFTFEGAAPGYQVRYVSRVTDQAGRTARRSWPWCSSRPGPTTAPVRPPSPPPISTPAPRPCARCASPATSRARSRSGSA